MPEPSRKSQTTSVRFEQAAINTLAVIAMVEGTTISEQLRKAVDTFIDRFTSDEGNKERIRAAQREQEAIFDALLGRR